MSGKLCGAFLLLSMSLPALAQYAQPTPGPAAEPSISPNRGQDQHQLWTDRYECYGWAKGQSGYDAGQSGNAAAQDSYQRAFTACMSGRGYSISYSAAPASPPPPPPPPPPMQSMYMRQYWWESPELVYRPVHVAIEGGYTATAGSIGDALDDGGNIGVGVSYFPSRSLPLGLRVDGSWSRFDANHAYYDSSGNYSHSHENIYGGDADLQFNLAQPNSHSQFYLLGGAGWYREQHVVEQFVTGCGFYYCGSYYSNEKSDTTGWRSSWNAGFGGEVALPGGTSFFVEARYQRIAPHNSDMQFVPIRVGLRF